MNGGSAGVLGRPAAVGRTAASRPVARLAATFGQEPANGVEWYFPRRLTIDTDAASAMDPTEAANFLGLRLFHTNKIDDPLYVIQTNLTSGRVLQGGRNLITALATTKKESMLVNAEAEQAHLDPLIAAPKTNRFYKTVDDFLRKIVEPPKRGRKKGKK